VPKINSFCTGRIKYASSFLSHTPLNGYFKVNKIICALKNNFSPAENFILALENIFFKAEKDVFTAQTMHVLPK
jgi:hypothetical protein